MAYYIALPIVGFIVGLLIISLGGGGGAVYVGILTTLFNIPPAIAATTSLATTIPTTAVGTFSHWKAGNVNLRFGLTMLVSGAVGSMLGSLCSGFLPESLYNKITGLILLLLAIQMLVSYIKKKRKHGDTQNVDPMNKKSNTIKAVCFGLLGGIMSGLVGLSGGGPIIAGLMILGCQALETVGTSVLVLFGIAVTGFLTHLGIGTIDWQLVGLLTIGTVCGAFVGPFLLKRINKQKLEKVLQPVLFLMIVTMGSMEMFK
ncbi:sulfite exporter TauE/SafE family protein [Pectinatus frisingensis]|uniref:sulfite exporter TauE/SafE family protein n=1 Tax=Pectinatus frisingensis TaxID=865 RepID=UPI0018C76B6E|nr:sulfite exporter TauE/SafE family protein [Pectinatus frisingensis]